MKKILISVSATALLLTAGALVVPRLVDWNDYRDELARRVGDAAGRPVSFDGDIGLQLLPAPALTADDIRVKAPPGFARADMATLKRLEVRVALAPLLSGRIQVESIVAVAPHVVVETDADGRVNWRVGGAGAGAGDDAARGGMGSLAQLLGFDRITLDDGRLDLIDGRNGAGETIDKINLRVVAGSLTGPFQASGDVSLRGAPLQLEATTGRFADGAAAPVRLALTLPGGRPERASGVRFAGIVSPVGPGPRLQGDLRLEGPDLRAALQPLRNPGAAASDLPARPFSLRAGVEAEGDRIRFDGLEATLGDARGAGAASFTVGDVSELTLSLLFNRLDIDPWLPPPDGGPAPTPSRNHRTAAVAGSAEAPAAAAVAWPEKLRAKIDLTVDAATWAGGTFRQGRLTATVTKDGAAVERLSALLPGGAALSAAGDVAFAAPGPRADFRFEAAADDLRALTDWLRWDTAGIAADRLRKARVAGRIAAAPGRVELADVEMTLDGTGVQGALTVELRARPAFGLRLTADRLDLDAYLPTAPASPDPADASPADAGAPPAAAGGNAPDAVEAAAARLLARGDVALSLTADELIVGGRTFRGVGLDAAAAGGALEVREATVDDLAGVRLRFSGQAGGFAPLKGAYLTVQAETPDAAGAAARLLPAGFADLAAAVPPGRGAVQTRLAGDRDKLAVESVLETAGGRLELGGEILKPLALTGMTAGNGGRFDLTARLSHPDADAAAALAGGRIPAGPGPLDLYAKLTGDAHRLHVTDVKGMVGTAAVAGAGDFNRKAVRPRVEFDLQTGILDLDRLIAAPSGGGKPAQAAKLGQAAEPAAKTATATDLAALRRFDGRFALTAAGLRLGGVDFNDVAAKLHLADGVLAADRFDAGLAGGRVGGRAELAAAAPDNAPGGARPPRFMIALTAEGVKPTAAAVFGPLSAAGATVDAEADLSVTDPFAEHPLRRLAGTARLAARGGALKGVDLVGLRDRLRQADRPQALVEGVLRGLQGGETRITALDAGFTIRDGTAETNDTRIETPAGGVGATGRIDLAARTIDMLLTVEPDVDPAPPPLTVRLSGPLDAPVRSLDVGALQRRLLERAGGAVLEDVNPSDLPGRLEAPVRDLLRGLIR